MDTHTSGRGGSSGHRSDAACGGRAGPTLARLSPWPRTRCLHLRPRAAAGRAGTGEGPGVRPSNFHISPFVSALAAGAAQPPVPPVAGAVGGLRQRARAPPRDARALMHQLACGSAQCGGVGERVAQHDPTRQPRLALGPQKRARPAPECADSPSTIEEPIRSAQSSATTLLARMVGVVAGLAVGVADWRLGTHQGDWTTWNWATPRPTRVLQCTP